MTHDESLDKLKKGSESRAIELKQQSDRANAHITALQKQVKDLVDREEAQKIRLEVLEALADRPKGTPAEQLEKKHAQAWLRSLRSGFQDPSLQSEVQQLTKQIVVEAKANEVLSGTALQGGNAVPRIVSESIDRLVLKLSDILPEVNTVTAG